MENTEKTNSTKEVINKTDGGGSWGGSCSFWIFGNEESANTDLKDKFEIAEDEKKD